MRYPVVLTERWPSEDWTVCQIDRLLEVEDTNYKIRVTAFDAEIGTKWLNVTPTELAAIRDVLERSRG